MGLAHDPVIGLIIAPDLILGLPVSGGEKEDDFVVAVPNIVG
jgi:hypothetical protein